MSFFTTAIRSLATSLLIADTRTMQIAILGRQPKISLAELESLFGAEKIQPVSDYAALVDSNEALPQFRLGGTIKSAKVLTRLENTNLEGGFSCLQSLVLSLQAELPDGKLQFGVSVYGFKAQKNWLLRQMLELKKIIKREGRSVRIIENKAEALETAQVLYNKLTSQLGIELLIIKNGSSVIIARTTAVQDIDAYAKRDHDRPKRDAYVGMLPPKLAQIMVNLTVCDTDPKYGGVVLDPFCGTGVVLQEASLMGFDIYGSDVSEKMVEYTDANLLWLLEHPMNRVTPSAENRRYFNLETADATTHIWKYAPSFVVCETYLGRPLLSLPSESNLKKIMHEANTVAEGFLRNIAPQLKRGTRLCLALPAWFLGNAPTMNNEQRFLHLKVLDSLEKLGYNRLDLVHASQKDLIYHRENQIVARELTLLVRS